MSAFIHKILLAFLGTSKACAPQTPYKYPILSQVPTDQTTKNNGTAFRTASHIFRRVWAIPLAIILLKEHMIKRHSATI